MSRIAAGVFLSALLGCHPAVLTGAPPLVVAESRPLPVTVVVEPFFDTQGSRREAPPVPVLSPTGTTLGYGAYGAYGPEGSEVGTSSTESPHSGEVKNLFNRVDTLAEEHARVLSAVSQLRPAWRVETTAALLELSGPVTLVRVVVGQAEVLESDRAYKTLAFGFGIVLPPLLLLQIGGVDETQRVCGLLDRYEADALQLRPRLLRYRTQPDFAVDTRGLSPKAQPFGLELSYNEGVTASQTARERTLVEGFVQQLAMAIVALVEGVPDAAQPPRGQP